MSYHINEHLILRVYVEMIIVILTAVGVGGATILGAVIGFIFRNLTYPIINLIILIILKYQ